ncbi:MAG: hypothetical protein QOG68_2359, partial [Solirubrobacteraceae bacterium]|nr:hypothetical protein [Solirubrobacteraceae bacterium]
MRLRLLVPRRGRAGSLGGLALLVAVAGCGGTGARTQTTPPPVPTVPAFAVGIDEKNPHLLAPGDQPAPFARFRDALAALKPSYVRVLVDWSTVQKSPGVAPDFAELKDGCARGAPPCAPYNGIRDTLRAVKALGARPVILIYGTPDWAAEPAAGCERSGVTPYARMPRIAPYRALLRALRDLVGAEGIEAPLWSAWNEPNTPTFLNPQRAGCAAGSRTLAAGRYARLAAALVAAVGADHVLLGEAAG